MAKGRNRGQQPRRAEGKVSEPPPRNYDDETPKFCLHYLRPGFDVHALDHDGQAALARTMQKLSSLTWKQLLQAGRHGAGFELIPAGQIGAPILARFGDVARFMVFRYSGQRPMGGYRVGDVYHILWIEREFGELYHH
jgi:hypothetical protein